MKSCKTAAVVALIVGLGLLPVVCRAADAYKVDPVHSTVLFGLKHMGVGYIFGRFDEISGTVQVDEQNAAGLVFDVQVKAESVDTNNAKRDQHLKGPDFFNVKEFPAIAFKSREVKPGEGQSFMVTGDLTLHGVTRPLTVKLDRVGSGKDPTGAFRTGFVASFTIKRSDFGMKFMPEAIGDDVRLTVAFEGVRQ